MSRRGSDLLSLSLGGTLGGQFACRSEPAPAPVALRVRGALTLRYEKTQKRSVLGRSVKSALNSTRESYCGPQCGKVPQFVFFAAVIPSLVEPVRTGSLV